MGLGRIEATGGTLPFSRHDLGQRNPRWLAGRGGRPTRRRGPGRPGKQSLSPQALGHRRSDHPVGPLPPWPTGTRQRQVVAGPGRIDHSLLDSGHRSFRSHARAPSRFPRATWSSTNSWPSRPRSMPKGWCSTAAATRPNTASFSAMAIAACWANRSTPTPVVALVRTLVPQSAVQVPASRRDRLAVASFAGAGSDALARLGGGRSPRSSTPTRARNAAVAGSLLNESD